MEFKRLGDIATYINGYAFKPEQWSCDGKPIIRIQNLNNKNAMYNYFNEDINEKYIVRKGDILISWSASIGVYEWELEDALLNQHIFKVSFDKEVINKSYFKFMVELGLNRALQYMHGSTMKHITKKYFDDILIPVPSLENQCKIAEALDKAQELIDKRKEQIEALDELVKSRFIEMFGDPYLNDKGFIVETINDVCSSIVRGPFGSALKKEFFVEPANDTCKVYEQKHAIQKKHDIGEYYVTKDKYEELKRFECGVGDILMSCSGTMGELYQLPEDCERGIINQALCKFTLNNKILPIMFLTYMKQTIGNLETKGSGIKNIASVSYIKSMPVMVPPIELQNRFADFVKQVDKLKFEMETSLKELEDNFNSLMKKAFKGELFN